VDTAAPSQQSPSPGYVAMLAEDGHQNPPAFLHEAEHFCSGVSLRGRTMLEIGSGRGLFCIYAAVHGGASLVVSMEPELEGSRDGTLALQQRRLTTLGVANVELVAADFNAWQSGGRRFDVVVSRKSINHLFPSTRNAARDRDTFDGYVRVAERIRAILNPGGVAIVSDAGRYAFFTMARDWGIRRPWNRARTGIDWRHHQNPGVWRRIFRAAGFSHVGVRYPLPHRLRTLKGLVDTAAANFFLDGTFILQATR
jgi:SAM-dependent methyltransferase